MLLNLYLQSYYDIILLFLIILLFTKNIIIKMMTKCRDILSNYYINEFPLKRSKSIKFYCLIDTWLPCWVYTVSIDGYQFQTATGMRRFTCESVGSVPLQSDPLSTRRLTQESPFLLRVTEQSRSAVTATFFLLPLLLFFFFFFRS